MNGRAVTRNIRIGILAPWVFCLNVRKKGVGAKLMRRVCDEVDALKAIAYLETDRERNVGLYRKFGFEVVDESMILDVKNTYMKRDPKL